MARDITEPLDNLLLRAGVSREQIEAARERAGDGELGPHLEELAQFPQLRWAALLAERCGLSFSPDLDYDELQPELLDGVSLQYCRNNRVLPLRCDDECVTVATSDPLRPGPLQDLKVIYRKEVDPLVVPGPVLTESIIRAFDRASSIRSDLVEGIETARPLELEASDLSEVPDLLEAQDEAPVIRLVNSIIFQAARDGASDIHLEPFEKKIAVRYRIDGMMMEIINPPRSAHAALVSRVKVMASLDIAEKRLPQDGGIRTRVAGRELDIRVSTVPTAYGERVVMRLLDRSDTLPGLAEMDFSGHNLDQMKHLISGTHGVILVTGPTGSGKTTTLYAALSEINSEEKNIITIEDPVEYQLEGIGQMQVNPRIGLTFANGLRSILRQDPDVIMVGEIRDSDTARIAIQAALTGHLVFSTLHTNDAASAVSRLLDMGIEPFLVSSAVVGILAQRLVRRLCLECSVAASPAESGLAELGLGYMLGDNSRLRIAGSGCDRCRNTGYRGRMAIHELLVVDDTMRAGIMKSADAATLRRIMSSEGSILPLRDDAVEKVRRGLSSVAEVVRVTSESAAS